MDAEEEVVVAAGAVAVEAGASPEVVVLVAVGAFRAAEHVRRAAHPSTAVLR
jgi:hypothetical protein